MIVTENVGDIIAANDELGKALVEARAENKLLAEEIDALRAEIEDDDSDDYDSGYDAGYGDGRDEGESTGYDDGHENGYDEGFTAGIDSVAVGA